MWGLFEYKHKFAAKLEINADTRTSVALLQLFNLTLDSLSSYVSAYGLKGNFRMIPLISFSTSLAWFKVLDERKLLKIQVFKFLKSFFCNNSENLL